MYTIPYIYIDLLALHVTWSLVGLTCSSFYIVSVSLSRRSSSVSSSPPKQSIVYTSLLLNKIYNHTVQGWGVLYRGCIRGLRPCTWWLWLKRPSPVHLLDGFAQVAVQSNPIQSNVSVCLWAAAGDWGSAVACMRLLRVQHVVNWDESTLSLLWDQKKRLVCPKCHPISTTIFCVEYHSSVLRFLAAKVTWELPGRLRAFGIPFSNWHVLLCRHQLGATWLTVRFY